HVLVGDLPIGVRPAPDPDEVAELRWVSVPTLLAELESDSRSYAPWLLGVTQRLAPSAGLAVSSSGTASSGTAASVDAGFVEPDGR
ncbi:MAG: isopentenyl-diphosphate delta-isomerase, partial [Actinomycetota bacterium]|nr:isopentenyl-diphosphate delta-isomerase [Actinomycetota bacterium]